MGEPGRFRRGRQFRSFTGLAPLARIYYVQMVERGKDHQGALCVVAVTPERAKAIIAEHWTVPADVRARRRGKKAGKAPKNVLAGRSKPGARGAGERGDLPQPASSACPPGRCQPAECQFGSTSLLTSDPP